jgi:hypothetical protein
MGPAKATTCTHVSWSAQGRWLGADDTILTLCSTQLPTSKVRAMQRVAPGRQHGAAAAAAAVLLEILCYFDISSSR